MNRREFQTSLAATLGLGSLSLLEPTLGRANTVRDVQTKKIYRYRLRYTRKKQSISFWLRVSDTARLDADVPVALVLSTDAAASNVVAQRNYIARALNSHIVRPQILKIDRGSWTPPQPLYASLKMGESGVASRVWKLSKV